MSRDEDIKLLRKYGIRGFKPERHSYEDENGQKWLQCKFCCEYQKVDDPVGYITCSICVVTIDMIKFPDTIPQHSSKKSTGRPPGWHFMNEYVDKDGNVYHKGKEQPDLKGTLPVTEVKPPKKRKKIDKDAELFRLAAKHKKKRKKK